MNKKEITTIPNILSILRIILIPIYSYIYLTATTTKQYRIAACIFVLSSITDMLDGIIARKFNMISQIGKILDPIADKVTQGIVMICLSFKYNSMWILFVFFLIKESFMAIMGIINLIKGKMLNGAKFSGKICTAILFICMSALMFFPNMTEKYVNSLIIISAFFMLFSFVSYIAFYTKHADNLIPSERSHLN